MISYDEAKRIQNLAKHGIDFAAAAAFFDGYTICHEDTRDAYGEKRFQSLGLLGGVVVFVVHTARGETDHIISIRKAQKHEESIFWKNYPD